MVTMLEMFEETPLPGTTNMEYKLQDPWMSGYDTNFIHHVQRNLDDHHESCQTYSLYKIM